MKRYVAGFGFAAALVAALTVAVIVWPQDSDDADAPLPAPANVVTTAEAPIPWSLSTVEPQMLKLLGIRFAPVPTDYKSLHPRADAEARATHVTAGGERFELVESVLAIVERSQLTGEGPCICWVIRVKPPSETDKNFLALVIFDDQNPGSSGLFMMNFVPSDN